MKRIVSLVLALSMVLSMFSAAFAGTTLPDVEGTDYEAAVSALVELGIVNGYEDGSYKPAKEVTRAEMAKFLVVAAGLEPAADVSKGATKFSDVAASHWATGYINVATEYGYINGYPDGTFAPDATVSYAEAVTMAIRVLGYRTVVEAKGTWPTNYIAKAQELKVLRDISYGKYTDGAIRGNVAVLMWNMLRTRMWDVEGENETNGLNYAKMGTMIDKYFEDYTYAKVDFVSYRINEGKVLVTLNDYRSNVNPAVLENTEYEYFGNDFFAFVNETEVEVLVNEDDATLLMMIATNDNNLVDGKIEDLEEDKYTGIPHSGDYAYVSYIQKSADQVSIVKVENTYVEKVDVKADYIKVNGKSLKNSDGAADLFEDEVVIKDGERASIEDIEVGDVLTKVTNYTFGGYEEFYYIGTIEAEGKLTKYVVDSATSVGTITVDDEEYTLDANAEYVEDPEDEDEVASDFASAGAIKWADMKNEEVVLVCDAVVGKVVRIEFDGNIEDDEDDTTGGFYAITGNVERPSSRTYTIELENENGKDEYTFEDITDGKTLYNSPDDLVGQYAYVELNDDGEITLIKVILTAINHVPTSGEIQYGKVSGEKYMLVRSISGEYDVDYNGIVDSNIEVLKNGIEVTDDVIVVTIITDDNGTKNNSGDDEYSITFQEGLEAIEGLKNDDIVIIYDFDAPFYEAKYVVLFDEISEKSDIKAAILEDCAENKLGEIELELETVDGKELSIRDEADATDYSVYKAVVYKTEEDEDDLVFEFIAGLKSGDLSVSGDGVLSGDQGLDYVVEANGQKVNVQIPSGDQSTTNFGTEAIKTKYEECTFVLVEVSESEDFLTDGTYDVDSIEVVDYEDIRFNKYDRISGDENDEVVFIIRGMGERE